MLPRSDRARACCLAYFEREPSLRATRRALVRDVRRWVLRRLERWQGRDRALHIYYPLAPRAPLARRRCDCATASRRGARCGSRSPIRARATSAVSSARRIALRRRCSTRATRCTSSASAPTRASIRGSRAPRVEPAAAGALVQGVVVRSRVRARRRGRGPFDLVHGFGKTSRQDVYFDGSGCLADFQTWSIDGAIASPWRRRLRRASPHQRVVARIERARYTRGNYRRVLAISELVRQQILDRYGCRARDVETAVSRRRSRALRARSRRA
jgi:hypothetical protein